ncbi:MAG: glutathione S-transferase family protein [Betaproteobacteria bacterium]
MIVLYHATASTCSQKVRLALAEKGLAWEGHALNLRAFDQLKPEFLALNPKGMVPVLVHEGQVLTESMVINEYLDEAFPAVPLRPADALGRARVREWTLYIATEPTWAIKAPSYQKNLRPALQGTKSEAEFAEIAAKMPDQENAQRWVIAATRGFTEAELDIELARLAQTLDRMQAALETSAWLAGDAYTLADVDMAPFVHRLAAIGQGAMIETRPRVADWYARISARPAFKTAFV